MTGGSVGTMRTNMTMRCEFCFAKRSFFAGKNCGFLPTLQDDSCRMGSCFLSLKRRNVLFWVVYHHLFQCQISIRFFFSPRRFLLVGGSSCWQMTQNLPGHSLLRWPKLAQTLSCLLSFRKKSMDRMLGRPCSWQFLTFVTFLGPGE